MRLPVKFLIASIVLLGASTTYAKPIIQKTSCNDNTALLKVVMTNNTNNKMEAKVDTAEPNKQCEMQTGEAQPNSVADKPMIFKIPGFYGEESIGHSIITGHINIPVAYRIKFYTGDKTIGHVTINGTVKSGNKMGSDQRSWSYLFPSENITCSFSKTENTKSTNGRNATLYCKINSSS